MNQNSELKKLNNNSFMKRIFIFIFLCISLCLYAGNPNRIYNIKYVEQGSIPYKKEMTLKVSTDKIYYYERDAYWNCKYVGTTKDSNGLLFHKYMLPSSGSTVLISDAKIMKIGSVYYYIIILNGQYHYAL